MTTEQLREEIAALLFQGRASIHLTSGEKETLEGVLSLVAEHDKSQVELLEIAWGVIANASGGDWKKEPKDWQEAAVRWRDMYDKWLNEHHPQPIEQRKRAGL